MSSLTLKGKPSAQASLAPVNSGAPLTSKSSNASSVMNTPITAPVCVNSTMDLADQPVPGSPTSTDGWGEIENGINEGHDKYKDGWDNIEPPLEEPKPSPVLANIQAAQKRPVSQPISQPKPQATRLRPKTTVKAMNNEDEDIWGSIGAPAPKSTSRPLNVRAASAPNLDEDDPWAAIAAPPPTKRAKPLAAGRGRGAKPAATKLGAQRINRTSSTQNM